MNTRTKAHLTAFMLVVAVITALSYTTVAYAAPALLNALFGPIEWYTVPSMFFRSATNPGYVIPVMASDGYRMPVDATIAGGVTLTIGSSTFTSSPVFSDAGGSTTLALVDSSRRIVITLGSDGIALVTTIASITNRLNTLSAQEATETLNLLAAQASVTAKLSSVISQQATGTSNTIAAVASIANVVSLQTLQQATETLSLLAAQASATAQLTAMIAAQASTTAAINATQSVTVTNFPTTTQISNLASSPAVFVTPAGVASAAMLDSAGAVKTSGSVTLAGSLPLQYWGVGAPTGYQAAIATNAKTLLSSLASFTANQYVEIGVNAKCHIANIGLATASMQYAQPIAADTVKGFRVGTSTFDLAIQADAAAVASLDVKVYTLY